MILWCSISLAAWERCGCGFAAKVAGGNRKAYHPLEVRFVSHMLQSAVLASLLKQHLMHSINLLNQALHKYYASRTMVNIVSCACDCVSSLCLHMRCVLLDHHESHASLHDSDGGTRSVQTSRHSAHSHAAAPVITAVFTQGVYSTTESLPATTHPHVPKADVLGIQVPPM